MPEKDPFSYSVLTYAWVVCLSGWGGIVNFIRKLHAGNARPFNVTELVGEIIISAFAGLITFWLCEASDINPFVGAALIGVSGHMGSRAIFAVENLFHSRLGTVPAAEPDRDNKP